MQIVIIHDRPWIPGYENNIDAVIPLLCNTLGFSKVAEIVHIRIHFLSSNIKIKSHWIKFLRVLQAKRLGSSYDLEPYRHKTND